MREELHDLAISLDKSIMFADGLDDALIGYLDVEDEWLTSVYDTDKIIEILQTQGMDYDEAVEWHYQNVAAAYVGPGTPCYVERPVSYS